MNVKKRETLGRIALSIICMCLCSCTPLYAASRSGPKQETSPQAVLSQFFNIIAHSLEFAAQSGDKEAQMHALAGIVQNISNIVTLASKSPQDATIVIKTLRELNNERLKKILTKILTSSHKLSAIDFEVVDEG